jgi:hypothetical protein
MGGLIVVSLLAPTPLIAADQPSSSQCTCHGAANWIYLQATNICFHTADSENRSICGNAALLQTLEAIEKDSKAALEAAKQKKAKQQGNTVNIPWMLGFGPDPYGYVQHENDDGSRATGLPLGTSRSTASETTYAGGGAALPFDLTNALNLGAGQQLKAGGIFNYESQDRDFNDVAALRTLGLTGQGGVDRDDYTVGGFVRYDFGRSYIGALGTGSWGNGNYADPFTQSGGDFDTNGYLFAGAIAHSFALSGAPSWTGGSGVALDFNAYAGAYKDQVDGFAERGGLRWGAEELTYGFVGGEAKLSARSQGERFVWIPYVAVNLVQDFDYSHTLKVPEQPGVSAFTVHFDDGETYWAGRLGLDVVAPSGLQFGIDGWAGASDDLDNVGGRAYFVYPFGAAHSASVAPPQPIK